MRYYCAYTPYMFAYVVLVLQWIFLPILLCCSCMIVWTMFCAFGPCGGIRGAHTMQMTKSQIPPRRAIPPRMTLEARIRSELFGAFWPLHFLCSRDLATRAGPAGAVPAPKRRRRR